MDKKTRIRPMLMLEKKKYVAHRGLFDPATERQENSIPAFRWAVANGYPIELDVQLTSDRKLVVFHDETLTRMCGVDKKVRDCTYAEIQTYHLGNTDLTVPLFSDVLKVIGGKVPVIVEIKSEGDWKKTTEHTACMLDQYQGPFVVECFHPLVVLWLRKNRPDFVRGQLSTDFFKDDPTRNKIESFLLTHLAFNGITKPDFVAYNHQFRDRWPVPSLKKKKNVRPVCWTIRSQEELEASRSAFDVFIFDSFIPDQKKTGKS